MPELNFNALIPRQDFFQGYTQGQERQNTLAQQAQARQLGDIQLQNALREQQAAAAESEAWKGGGTPQDVSSRLMAQGLGRQAMAVQKQSQEQKTAQLTQAKTQHELIKGAANQVFANPQAAAQILTNFSRQTGIDVADDLAQLQQLGNDPAKVKDWAAGIAIEADKLTPKFHAITIPGKGVQTGTTDISGKFTPGELYKEQMSEAQRAANAIAQQRAGYEGQRVGLEGQRIAIAQQELDRKVAGGELKPVPVHAQKAITGAAASIGKLSDAIDLLKGLEVAGQKGSKTAVGLKAYTPDIALNRLDPEGTVTRAAIADIGSMIMHDRSGAAVTVSESPRLKPFIPLTTDNAETALKKLERLRKIQLDDAEALTGTYNPEQGYKSFKTPTKGGATKAVAPTIAPPSGFTPD